VATVVQAASVLGVKALLHLVAQTAAMVATAVRYGWLPITTLLRYWLFEIIPTDGQAMAFTEWAKTCTAAVAKT
jgi:hypothetical protein